MQDFSIPLDQIQESKNNSQPAPRTVGKNSYLALIKEKIHLDKQAFKLRQTDLQNELKELDRKATHSSTQRQLTELRQTKLALIESHNSKTREVIAALERTIGVIQSRVNEDMRHMTIDEYMPWLKTKQKLQVQCSLETQALEKWTSIGIDYERDEKLVADAPNDQTAKDYKAIDIVFAPQLDAIGNELQLASLKANNATELEILVAEKYDILAEKQQIILKKYQQCLEFKNDLAVFVSKSRQDLVRKFGNETQQLKHTQLETKLEQAKVTLEFWSQAQKDVADKLCLQAAELANRKKFPQFLTEKTARFQEISAHTKAAVTSYEKRYSEQDEKYNRCKKIVRSEQKASDENLSPTSFIAYRRLSPVEMALTSLKATHSSMIAAFDNANTNLDKLSQALSSKLTIYENLLSTFNSQPSNESQLVQNFVSATKDLLVKIHDQKDEYSKQVNKLTQRLKTTIDHIEKIKEKASPPKVSTAPKATQFKAITNLQVATTAIAQTELARPKAIKGISGMGSRT